MGAPNKEVARKLRLLARDWSMYGIPDILTATLSLYDAFG